MKLSKWTSVETETYKAVFVNRDQPPDEIIPLEFYKPKDDESIWRLCRLVYWDEYVRYEVLDWVEYPIKPYTSSAIILICKAMRSLKEFLLEAN